VGLGKTLVAKGIIAKALDLLWEEKECINIVYICSNSDIARQNINRLNITDNGFTLASRITLLPSKLKDLHNNKVNFISFTPGTSFNLRSSSGIIHERALLYTVLKEAWQFGKKAGPRNLLQCDAGRDNWQKRIKRFATQDIDSGLKDAFIDSLDRRIKKSRQKGEEDLFACFENLTERFGFYRKHKNISKKDRIDRNAFIGELRSILAATCIHALKPDIIILDEFQRFKTLLDGKDEMSLLAQELFNYEDARVLLLSATPYKMYTMNHESQDEDHYSDFLRTLSFLFGSEEETDQFRGLLKNYRRELYSFSQGSNHNLKAIKEEIELALRRVMIRTERLSVTSDRDGMVKEVLDHPSLQYNDLLSFRLIDEVAQAVEAGDHMEYWKSAPYLLNFMDKYFLKDKFEKQLDSDLGFGLLSEPLSKGKSSLLAWKKITSYNKVDPANARLRVLMDKNLDKGWQYLWVPPSFPYYKPHGVYANPEAKDFTKALVFSAWQVVPKVISSLCSYEAERRMIRSLPDPGEYREIRKKIAPRLLFATSQGRLTGMPALSLLYPCLTLALEIDPLNISTQLYHEKGTLPTYENIYNEAKEKIKILLKGAIDFDCPDKGPIDDSWYWASLALLDHHHYREPTSSWLKEDKESIFWKSLIVKSRKGEDEDTKYAEHANRFIDYFHSPESLGRPPGNLLDVLTKMALASPAITALRSLTLKLGRDAIKEPVVLNSAAKIASGFRTLYNLSDSIALIWSLKKKEPYWERTLEYGASGNLQAVMDEYLHVLYESLGLMGKPAQDAAPSLAEAVYAAVSIRTATSDFDEIRVRPTKEKIELKKQSLRCRYALRFSESKNDEDDDVTREDQVRTAFNSPFKPFILATTSIGQEGLDFHQYCHAIFHWNLPSNPVDLEQREGRIHRYKGHVIRKNIAKHFGLSALTSMTQKQDPWDYLFDQGVRERPKGTSDLIPYWIFETEGGYKVERHIPSLPLSRDINRVEDLKRTLAVYRMVFGQPRQEDLVKYLKENLQEGVDLDEILSYRIDLSP
jgi:hypothetical protein